MSKKVYRSLFDSDDVFEVEQLEDDDTAEEDKVIKKEETVKVENKDDDEVTLKAVFDLLKEIAAGLKGTKVADSDQDPNEGGSTAGCEPDGEMKVTPVKPILDEDEEEIKKVEETAKEVKDAYSSFARAGEGRVECVESASQKAFQDRYNKVANK